MYRELNLLLNKNLGLHSSYKSSISVKYWYIVYWFWYITYTKVFFASNTNDLDSYFIFRSSTYIKEIIEQNHMVQRSELS